MKRAFLLIFLGVPAFLVAYWLIVAVFLNLNVVTEPSGLFAPVGLILWLLAQLTSQLAVIFPSLFQCGGISVYLCVPTNLVGWSIVMAVAIVTWTITSILLAAVLRQFRGAR